MLQSSISLTFIGLLFLLWKEVVVSFAAILGEYLS